MEENINFIRKFWFMVGMLVGLSVAVIIVALIFWHYDLPGRWEDKKQMIVEYHGKTYKLYEVEPSPKEWTKKE